MLLRCPLCLEALAPGARLYRFCHQHPARSAPFAISIDDYASIYCPEDGCRPGGALADGVFLAHEHCRCLNPFWDGQAVNTQTKLGFGNRSVEHWELGVLEAISQSAPELRQVPEMWFPQSLFRAANEVGNDGRPVGALVLMAGARNVGKTVLSLMAMNRFTYAPGVNAEHFVHITPEVGAAAAPEDLARTFAALDELRKNRWSEPIMNTHPAVSNLKSVYLSRANARRGKAPDPQAALGTRELLLEVLKRFVERPAATRGQPAPHAPVHVVLAFYDTAGEQWHQAADRDLLRLRQQMDVLAVVLDATGLRRFGLAPHAPDGAWVACERLEQARSFPGRRCLVVTKLDLVADDPDVMEYAEAVRRGRTPAAKPRELLGRWLDHDEATEQRLAAVIEEDSDLEVFLVWTEGLSAGSETGAPAPKCHGLVPFINWCLDIEQTWLAAAARP